MNQDNFNQNNQQDQNNNNQNYNSFNNDHKHDGFSTLVYSGVLIVLIGSILDGLSHFLGIFLDAGWLSFNYFGITGARSAALIIYNVILTLFSIGIFLVSLNFFLKKRIIIALLITILIVSLILGMFLVLVGAILAIVGYYTNNRQQQIYDLSQSQAFNSHNDQQFQGDEAKNSFVNNNNNVNPNSQRVVEKGNDKNNLSQKQSVFTDPSNRRSFKVKNKWKSSSKK